MTEESTPLETSANAESTLEESINADANEPVSGAEDAPSLDTVLEPPADGLESASASGDDNSPESSAPGGSSPDVEALKAQLEDRTGQYMRLAADFDNFRKRTTKEKAEFEERGKRQAIVELLPVIDNFERARSQIKPQTDAENNIQKSYQGIYKQLVDCLKQLGVAPMRPEGQPFDPNLHEAVMREPTNEYPEGTVIEELRRGYLLGEQVLRHAMVRVAAPFEGEAAQDSSGDETEGSSEES